MGKPKKFRDEQRRKVLENLGRPVEPGPGSAPQVSGAGAGPGTDPELRREDERLGDSVVSSVSVVDSSGVSSRPAQWNGYRASVESDTPGAVEEESYLGLEPETIRGAELDAKQRAARGTAKALGQLVARLTGRGKHDPDGPLAVGTVAGKGATHAVVSVLALAGAFGFIRGFFPNLLWDPSMDAAMIDRINEGLWDLGQAFAFITFVWGVGKNLWKNWEKRKNGVALVRKTS